MKPRLRRSLSRLLCTVAACGALVAVFYAEENWRGARAWDGLRRELAARGESLDPRDFIPPPVPDGQNLAMAPLFERALPSEVDPRTGRLTFAPASRKFSPTRQELEQMPGGTAKQTPPKDQGAWNTGNPVALEPWQRFYLAAADFPHPASPQSPAEDVLLALTRYAPLLDELAQAAAERPQTRFPLNWTLRPASGMSLPHLTGLMHLTKTLRLRALARLAAGQTAAAKGDLDLMCRLRQASAGEPTLISALTETADLHQLLQPVWEGLRARQWTATDLTALQRALGDVNVLRSLQQGVRGGERCLFIAQMPDDVRQGRFGRDFPGFLTYLPHGWYVFNAVVTCRLLQTGVIDAVDPAQHRARPDKAATLSRALTDMRTTPYNFLARLSLPVYSNIIVKFAQTQTGADQAAAACALERYYLDHQAYPASLDALVPAYLDRVPTDVVDGAPMRYRQTGDGRFQLWSVGWDGRDDGGSIEWPADRKWRRAPANGGSEPAAFPAPVKDQGDWVWQYTPAEPPDPPANRSRLE